MTALKITIADMVFDARLETEKAPKTCAAFSQRLPFESKIVHVRWSGEAVWIPLGDLDFGVGYENHTSFPAPGQIILYPGGISRDRDPACLWRRPFREQDGPACRQPFHHADLRTGQAARNREAGAL